MPLGPTEAIEDPRLVRIGNFEDGLVGPSRRGPDPRPVHRIVRRSARRGRRWPCCCTTPSSTNKIAQTLLEMVRGGVAGVPVDVTVFHPGPEALDPGLAARLPFGLRHLPLGIGSFADAARVRRLRLRAAVRVLRHVSRRRDRAAAVASRRTARLDAVWGSRRLSVRDIEESYRFRYARNAVAGTISRIGSHVLSLACLALYGRFVTDTLSGVRAVRAADVLDTRVDLTRRGVNHVLLAALLRRKAEILEVPVRFFPLSPGPRHPYDGARWPARPRNPHRASALAGAGLAARRPDYAADAPAPLRSAK